MEFLCLLLNSFFYLLSFGHVTTVASQESYKYQRLFVDKALPYSIAVVPNLSLTQCTAECSQKNECMGFTYTQMSKQCNLSEHFQFIVGELVVSKNGYNIYYTEDTGQVCSVSYSTHLASESQGIITSTNYPGFYDHNLDQYWLIVKPNRVSTLVLTFQTMDVENSPGCEYDSITLYDGYCTSDPQTAKLCGGIAQSFQVSGGLYFLIRFSTDSNNFLNIGHVGFSIVYYID